MKLSLEDFQKYKSQFKLGNLTTESFNSKSKHLSEELKTNLLNSIEILHSIDGDALNILRYKNEEIFNLQLKIQNVLQSGNKVFLSGCGATGRLAISMEKLYREMHCKELGEDQVVGFMAGGDYALISAVESFEDNFEYGEKQLLELGFTQDDLLLSVSEGGETNFVIGTANKAAIVSKHSPYFIYCNPDCELKGIKRSQGIITNSDIVKLNLNVGAMAISGSTRMQATTVQMIAIGFGLLYKHEDLKSFNKSFNEFLDDLIQLDTSKLNELIIEESEQYKAGGIVTYRASADLAISVLTDTTERAPTFSLTGFEKITDSELSLSYLAITKELNITGAWEKLLSRTPRCLDWDELPRDISGVEILKFDISESCIQRRKDLNPKHLLFEIQNHHGGIQMDAGDVGMSIPLTCKDLFFRHLCMKLYMNTHSTLVMGLLGRYQGNMMTYVKASNLKLVDRACRYIEELLKQEDIEIDSEKILSLVFEHMESKTRDKPIVLFVKDLIKAELN